MCGCVGNPRVTGTIEITVAFASAPKKLHVLLSEVWMHMRAEGLGFTLALPRQPKPGQRIKAFNMPSGTAFHFETLSCVLDMLPRR